MWVEFVLVVIAVAVAAASLTPDNSGGDPESPETDGESIEAFVQVAGAVGILVAAVLVIAGFELTWLVIRVLRARERIQSSGG